MLLKLDYPAITILREIILQEINICIDAARDARLRAAERGDYRESDIALRYENRAELLFPVLDQVNASRR